MVEKQVKVWFLRGLNRWNSGFNTRKMPWKGEKDPYKIWLSEIILQQTRVEQGWAYYLRFIQAYPTVQDLSQAPDNEVFKLWEGLGYYSRCRNLLHTARIIAHDHGGVFPATREGLLALKGIGSYTAAAIGSFAFGLPLAVVDGNVHRVLSRVFGINDPVDTPKGKKRLEALADALLDTKNPSGHNQAMMDLGATVCVPRNPHCAQCPFSKNCVAFTTHTVARFPVKSKKTKVRERYFYYLIVEHKHRMLVRQRKQGDVWPQLHEFLLRETDEPAGQHEVLQPLFWGVKLGKANWQLIDASEPIVHVLSHQRINARIVHIRLSRSIHVNGYEWMDAVQITQLAFPRLITRYRQSH